MVNFLNQLEDIVLKLKTNKIIIFGKGSSLDEINVNKLSEFFRIGLNDVERLVECDISIFYDNWVVEAIKDNGYKSKFYIAPKSFEIDANRILQSRYAKLEQDKVDLMFSRLSNINKNEDFVIEEVLFITALKLTRLISQIAGKKMDVYLVGFDFDPKQGYSKKLEKDYSYEKAKYRDTKIIPQEHYFENSLYILENSEVNISHIGNKTFSKMTAMDFNLMVGSNEIKINKTPSSVIIVAEFTTNHFGDRLRLEKMIKLAHSAGADMIKLQKRDVESFYTKTELDSKYVSPFGDTFRDYRNQLELTYDDFVLVDSLCEDLGIKWFASILDRKSFDFMMRFNPDIIKIPSTISEHMDYISYVANTYSKEIVVSTGMTSESYIYEIADKFAHNEKLYLMHTNSAYPTPLEDINIAIISKYKDIFKTKLNIIPAYSSHDDGSFGSIMAVAAGAKMIEKHVKLGVTPWAHFDSVALDLENGEFKKFVDDIRKAEIAYGSSVKKINNSENHKYHKN